MGAAPLLYIWDPILSPKLLELESCNFTNAYAGSNTVFGYEMVCKGRLRGAAPPSVNLGPPHIVNYDN